MKKILLNFIFISTCFLQTLLATDIIVTNTNDSGTGSLRDAISSATNGDRILFDSNISGQTIIFGSPIIVSGKSITIEGNSSNPMVFDGNNSVQLFQLSSATYTLKNLTLQNAGSTAIAGGAIQISSGSSAFLFAESVTFKGNTGVYGAAIHANAAISLNFDNCLFEDNNATGTNGGSAIYTDNELIIKNSSFINNTASIATVAGTIHSGGPGITMINSTCANNSANNRAGCFLIQGDSSIENSVIANNSLISGSGAGITLANSANLKIKNSVISENNASSNSDINVESGTITSYGYNFIGDTAGNVTANSGDMFDLNATNVGLGTLTKDGDSITYAYTLESNSSLIDAGSCFDINSTTITIDQFGNARPTGATCDIGAIEYTTSSNSVTIYLNNYNASEHNISSIRYIGANGSTQNYEINGSSTLSNGDNNLSLDNLISNTEFSIFIELDDNKSYWYNFTDNKLYGDLNLSENSFFENTNDINGSFSIDLNNSNFVEAKGDAASYNELINEFSENISDQNGSIRLDPHSDVDKDYYENNIIGNIMHFNPANLFWFEHRQDGNDSNTTRLNVVELNIYNPSDSNGTWTFSEKRYEDGNTTTEDENGTFTKDASHIYTIKESNASQADVELKFGETLDHTDLNSLISSKFTDINFSSSDQAMIVYIKQLIDEVETYDEKAKKYDSNGSFVGYFTSFSDFIDTYSSGSSWFMCVENDQNCSKGIGFPSDTNSSDTNGTLRLYNNDGNSSSILLSYAGTWKIESNIMYLEPIVDTRDENRIYELKSGNLYMGELNKAGEVKTDVWFNDSTLDKLLPYFGAEYNTLTSSDINWSASSNSAPVSSSDPINYSSINEESQFISNSISTIITDPDGDTLTYTISGTDASLFIIDSNSSILNSVSSSGFDYENPIDSNSDNIYELNVTASDGNKTITVAVNVSISNIQENSSISITTQNLDQNVSSIQLIGNETISLTSSDDINWSGTISDESNYDNNYSLQITTSDSATWYYNSCDNRLYSENNGSSCFNSIDINSSTLNTLSFDLNDSNWNLSNILLEAHGGILQLDGEGDYVSIPDVSGGILDIDGNITLEAWINLAAIDTNGSWIIGNVLQNSDGGVGSPHDLAYALRIDSSNGLHFTVGSGSAYAESSTYTLNTNQWYHVAGYFDSSSQKIGLIVDGVSTSEISTGFSTLKSDIISPLSIGSYIGYPQDFKGLIDEVRIWDTLRDESDINSTMNTQLDGNESGLVAYYNFDERTGDVVYDITSNNNDGMIDGNITRLNFLGDGLNFTAFVDGVTITDTSKLQNATNMSAHAWIKMDTDTSGYTYTIFEKYSYTPDQGFWLSINDSDKKLRALVGNASSHGDTSNGNSSAQVLSVGQWYHVGLTYDGQTIKTYVNGELDSSVSYTSGLDLNNSRNLFIGHASNPSYDAFDGSIAEVGLWNKALSSSEMKNIMLSSLNGNESGLVGYWPLYEGAGSVAYDKTSNSNDGNITGAIWEKTAPEIYGDTIYVSEGISSKFRLSLENNSSSSQTFSYNGTAPSEILSFSSTGNIIYKNSVEQNTSLSVQAVDGNTTIYKTLNVKVADNPNYKLISLSVTNVNLSENNITALTLIGQNGLDDVDVNISGVTNGDNNFSIETGEGNYTIKITLDDNSTWWYNSSSHTITKTNDSSSNYLIDTNVYSSLYANLSDSNWQNEAPVVNDNITYTQSVVVGNGTASNLINNLSNASSSTGINESWDLDYDDMYGDLLVAQYSSSNVFVLKPNKDINVTTIGDATTGYLSAGYDLGYALDRRGLIYEVDTQFATKTLILDIRSSSTTTTGDLASGSEDFYSFAYDEVNGDFYIGSEDTGYIYKVNIDTNVSTRITGTGTKCTSYASCPDGNVSTTDIGNVYGLAIHPSDGEIYFVENSINVVRKLSNGQIVTVAGNGTAATSGDGGLATSASLNKPFGIAFDSSGNLYISEESGNVIRKVDTSGYISTIVSSGLTSPRGIDIDHHGNIYAINWTNPQILKYTQKSIFDIELSENNSSIFINSSSYVSDPENDNLTYYILNGDSSYFDINSTSGEIKFITAPDYGNANDYDNNNVYEFDIIIDDGVNHTYQSVSVTIVEQNGSTTNYINILNYDSNVYNITNISYVGANGNSVYEDINGSKSLSNGDNNLSLDVNDSNADFSLQIQIDNNTTYWYNFNDGNFYAEHNLSDQFIRDLNDINNSLYIDFNTVNLISKTYANSYTSVIDEFSSEIKNSIDIELEGHIEVDSDYYENNISGILMPFNPANTFRFEHRNDNDGNETELSLGEVIITSPSDSSGTWQYSETKYEDGNESNESENGTFTKDGNNVIRIREPNETVDNEEFKFGEILAYTDLNNIISTQFTDINFTSGDEGVIVYFKNLITEVETHGEKVKKDENSTIYYTSFNDFISTHVNNDRWFSCVDSNCSKGIGFDYTTDPSDTNGTLVVFGNDSNISTLLLSNAGTWKIENDILYVYPTVELQHDNIYKLEDGYIYYAEESKAGDVNADIWFNDSAVNKLIPYFGGEYNTYTSNDVNWSEVINSEVNTTVYDTSLSLSSDFTVSGDTVVNGDLNISSGDLVIGAGSLHITGNLNILGTAKLIMTDVNGTLIIDGDALFGGTSTYNTVSVSHVNSGTIYLRGDFNQTGNINGSSSSSGDNKYSFYALNDNKVILDGNSTQNIYFESPNESQFANLTKVNSNVDFGDLNLSVIVSGTYDDQSISSNTAPVFTSSDSVDVNESTITVLTVVATDSEGDTLTYSITGGADASFFNINSTSGELNFNSAPDYENPQDGNINNVYRVQITVNDGNLSNEQNLSVRVKDVVDSSEIYINFIDHNSSEYNISTITAIGQDGLDQNISFSSSNDINWSSVISTDGNYTIRIDTVDGNTTKNWWFDFNDSKIYHELNGSNFITSLDINNSITYDINSSIAWENRVPVVSDVNISIDENNASVFVDLDDYITDYENDTITYNGYNGVDTNDLTLFVGGGIKFTNTPDYENPTDSDLNNIYHITVYADDGRNNISIPVTVNVLNIVDDNNVTISISSSDRNISSLNLIGDQNISLVNYNDTNWTGIINEVNFDNNYTLQIITDDSQVWYYNSCDNKVYNENDGSSCFSNIEINSNNLNSLSYDLNFVIELMNGNWEQPFTNSKYQSNSISDNSTYATLTVNKITNDESILELSQSSLGTMYESSTDINLSNIDTNTQVSLILSDDNNYSTKLIITPQTAIAYVYNGNTLESSDTIFTQDTSNYFAGKRVKLNTWFINNNIYFNVTDENNNQLGKIVQFSNNMNSFTKHTLEIVLNDSSSSAQSSVAVDFYGIRSNANITYTYYKRLHYLEFIIDSDTYTNASPIDANNKNWYQIQTDTNNSNYIYTKVGKINPINSYALEENIAINYKNEITNVEKQKTDLNITNYLIKIDENNDSIFDEEVKYISTVDLTTINSKLNQSGFNTSLTGSAGAHKLYSKQLITSCEVHHTDTSNVYSNSSDFVSQYSQGNSGNKYLMTNRFNNLKVLQFSSNNELVEYDLNTSSITTVGRYTELNNVSCTESNSNTTISTLYDMNLSVDGYDSTIGLNISNNRVFTEYKKVNDTKEIYFFNEEAAKQLTQNLGITKTPTKTLSLNTTTWNYVSLSSNITLCISEFQSALPSICNQDYTIEEVFTGVDAVLKYTGYWSYWDGNSSSSYNVDHLTTVSNKEGMLINTTNATTLNIPYNLFDKIETDVMDLYQTGWFLTSVPMDHTTSHLEDMVSSQGKTLKYVLYLDKDSNVSENNTTSSPWNVYSPSEDSLINSKYPRLNTIKANESFWLYVE